MPSIQQCTICFDELTDGLTAAPCGHVFHTICIDHWNRPGRCCPICHARLPRELLKLFYEPQQDAGGDAAATTSAGGACSSACPSPGSETGKADPVSSAEFTQLRRKVASSTKLIASQAEELKGLKLRLVVVETEAKESKEILERKVASATAKLEKSQIDLFKTLKELNKLKREMEGTDKRLREVQGDKVAYNYLTQFSSPATGRPLNGLGQTDVEKVLGQIRQGNAQAATIIRGQHEQLTRTIDREKRTKRELRSSKAESESMALELQQVRSKLNKAKKEAYRLEKAIEKKARADAQALNERTASPTSSSETLLGDWVAEERPRAEGMERTWALSRKSSNGSSGSKAESKRSTSSDGRSVLTSLGPSPRRAKRRREEKEIDLVSLGSDDDDDDDDNDDNDDDDGVENSEGFGTSSDGAAKEGVHGKREKRAADMWSLGLLERPAPVSSSRSFFTSFAATTAGGGAGVRPNQKPATFIKKGFNAVGGRHQVRQSSSSSSSRKAFSLGGKQSRLVATPRN